MAYGAQESKDSEYDSDMKSVIHEIATLRAII